MNDLTIIWAWYDPQEPVVRKKLYPGLKTANHGRNWNNPGARLNARTSFQYPHSSFAKLGTIDKLVMFEIDIYINL